jgi:hypothetical protein
MQINSGVQFHRAPPVGKDWGLYSISGSFYILTIPGGAFQMIIKFRCRLTVCLVARASRTGLFPTGATLRETGPGAPAPGG